jgi:hypothetical protein
VHPLRVRRRAAAPHGGVEALVAARVHRGTHELARWRQVCADCGPSATHIKATPRATHAQRWSR